jgi:hypothetical protein
MNSTNAQHRIIRPGRWPLLGWLAVLFLIAAQAEGILTSPPDRDMDDLEKILYVHLPAALQPPVEPTSARCAGREALAQLLAPRLKRLLQHARSS